MKAEGRSIVPGSAIGQLLFSNTPLSFWAGVDSQTGTIVDRHHPLNGSSISGRLLAIPRSRGSCSGSTILIELLLKGCAPAGLIFQKSEQIITLGVIVSRALFGQSIPVLILNEKDFAALQDERYGAITGSKIETRASPLPASSPVSKPSMLTEDIELAKKDQSILAGKRGSAAQIAMKILLDFATLQGARRLIDVSRAHIDACIYTGPASLQIPQQLLGMGARVAVPTTLNSISIDKRRWREIGMDAELASQADKLAESYLAMGATSSFTCAPYTLDSAPVAGENIGWAESNAVVFANSVLGARTQKYPDLIDVCIALTGRAPFAGTHSDSGRLPQILIEVVSLPGVDDSLYPVLGYHIGKLAGGDIPYIMGIEIDDRAPRMSDLKAFSAAFATTASAPMFHIQGITPEAKLNGQSVQRLRHVSVGRADLINSWSELNTAEDASVGLVSLGNPHFSLEEFDQLAELCFGQEKRPKVQMIVTTSRDTYERALKAGFVSSLEAFGASIITDTCWCMLNEPVIPRDARNIMTNSAKYAHYAPGMANRGVHFGSLTQCVEASCTGMFQVRIPSWIQAQDIPSDEY